MRQLKQWQLSLDSEPTYERQVAVAKATWPNRNRKDNGTFKEVRKVLARMCSGARRCCYCEDSCADEVEHIRPKDLYPAHTYDWDNYLYACGPCNGPKNNNFAVYDPTATPPVLIDVTRKRNAPVVPPTVGPAALLDPRHEDPADYLRLDLAGTFHFLPIHAKNTVEWLRADYTIKVLHLNDRDALVVARREAFNAYRARLAEYVRQKEHGADPKLLQRHVRALSRVSHPFVWLEMLRSRDLRQDLRQLFAQAPEFTT